MQEAQAIIERVRRTSATIQRLELAVDKAHRDIGPGQMLLARCTDSYEPYLREPWTAVTRQGKHLVIERPAGRTYLPGQVVSVIGPVGKPIPLRETINTLLLIAYDSTPASLLMLAESLIARKGAVTLVLIGRAQYYPVEALPQDIEVIRAEDHGSWLDREKTIRWAEQIVAVAPPPFDIAAYARLLDEVKTIRIQVPGEYVYGLFQPPMPCGVGACQACLVRRPPGSAGGGSVAACLEGPAFDLLDVVLNVADSAGE